MCFKFGKCTETCEKITNAMANSTGYPCIAAGLCPAVDEFGDVECKWSYKSMGCEPANSCVYKFPKCEMKSGLKKWKQVSRLLSDNLGAFDDAFRHRKRCSEPNAGPYCIREAEGLGLLAEWGGLGLTFLGGFLFSIHAIETPGGDDDRQWLTFWMIMMLFFVMERFTDVLLSKLPVYYECKFLAIVWLMFFQGADKLYRGARKSLKHLSRVAPWLFPPRKEMSEEEYILSLPAAMRLQAAELGLRKLWEGYTCDADLAAKFGSGTVVQLWSMWNKVDPRYLTIHLLSASNLPVMDVTTTDAYCIAYLVPPSPEAKAKLAEEDAAATAAASAKLAEFAALREGRKKEDKVLSALSRANTTPLPISPGRGRPLSELANSFAEAANSFAEANGKIEAAAAVAARSDSAAKAEHGELQPGPCEGAASDAASGGSGLATPVLEAARDAPRDSSDSPASGWAKARAKQRAAKTTAMLGSQLNTFSGALAALKKGEFAMAGRRLLWRLHAIVFGASKGVSTSFRKALYAGPIGKPGQYGGSRSKVISKSLNPVWNQFVEVRLEGGVLDSTTGEYDNDSAPYTRLRLEVWDRDLLSRDDFIGEVSVQLLPLMDARTHYYELPLTDPEGKCGADDGVRGTIRFELRYES